ncbi:MAG: 30S ribosomal protein S6 [Myxococcota bacterium]
MLSHEYETIIIVRPDIDDTAVFGIAEKVEAIVLGANGHVLDREDWGKRKLSYPIAKHQRGHYLRLNFLCGPSLVAEIERRIRNDDQVVRFMTLRLAIEVDAPTRIEQAAVQRARREEEMKRRAAEAALGLGDDDDDDFGDDDDDDDIGDASR